MMQQQVGKESPNLYKAEDLSIHKLSPCLHYSAFVIWSWLTLTLALYVLASNFIIYTPPLFALFLLAIKWKYGPIEIEKMHFVYLNRESILLERTADIPLEIALNHFNGGRLNGVLKRIFDICASLFLFPLAVSMIVFCALSLFVLYREMPFFIQKRTGHYGSIFHIIKIKTIYKNSSVLGHKFTVFLRKSGLDEIPQILNVLEGSMSFVGPRPELLEKTRSFDDIMNIRHKVKPGITGIWQLSVARDKDLFDHAEYDLLYILKASFYYDIALFFMTPFYSWTKKD